MPRLRVVMTGPSGLTATIRTYCGQYNIERELVYTSHVLTKVGLHIEPVGKWRPLTLVNLNGTGGHKCLKCDFDCLPNTPTLMFCLFHWTVNKYGIDFASQHYPHHPEAKETNR